MVGPGEGKGSCGTCRAEMCRAKTCRAAHVFNSMDVRAHDKPGLSPTVFSFLWRCLFFLFFRDFRRKKKRGATNLLQLCCYRGEKKESCNKFVAARTTFFSSKKNTQNKIAINRSGGIDHSNTTLQMMFFEIRMNRPMSADLHCSKKHRQK